MKLPSLPEAAPRKAHYICVADLKARLAHVGSWLHGASGQFEKQEASLIAASRMSEHPQLGDTYAESRVLEHLAACLLAGRSRESHATLSDRFRTCPWNIHNDGSRSMVKAALANCRRLYGFDCPLGVERGTGPTLSIRFANLIHRLLFDEWDDRDSFIQECRFCVAMIFEIKTSEVSGVEIGAILELVHIVAPFDLDVARRVLEIYEARLKDMTGLFSPMRPMTWDAILSFTFGCLAKASGDPTAALAHFNASLQVSHSLNNNP